MKILHLEDEKWFHQLILPSLAGHEVVWAETVEVGITKASRESFDLLLLDRNLKEVDSLGVLRDLKVLQPQAAILILSSDGDVSGISRALDLGADDYLMKSPQVHQELPLRIQQTLRTHAAARWSESRRQELRIGSQIVGESIHSDAMRESVSKVAAFETHVLITGETGTGKEVIASEIHRLRGDPLRPLVSLNCGAITEALFESELFGHKRGAFTGATHDREGLVLAAHGGDLFLDEIGELPLSQQVKLLRFLQEGTFTPVGSTQQVRANVRIIAATNRNLEKEVMDGRFREDLFYRLNVFRITTRPLRERVEDIIPLAEFFLKRLGYPHSRITQEAKRILQHHHWRGNVRELHAVIQRACIESLGEDLKAKHILIQNLGASSEIGVLPQTAREIHGNSFRNYVSKAERNYLSVALEILENDTEALSEKLQMSRATVYNRMKALGIPLPSRKRIK